ncbi:MAG: hypothetical protein ABI238_01695 [Terrimesophilobacter sp.]
MIFRIHRNIRYLALGVVASLLLTGCIGQNNDQSTPTDANLYMGTLPAPSPLPDAPDIPPYPTPPADTNNQAAMAAYNTALANYSAAFQTQQSKVDAQTAAVKSLAKVALAGGEKGVAAWESLLVTAGIAVLGSDGKPLTVGGQTGMGSPMTDADLRLQALLATAPGGVRLTDLADSLSVVFRMTASDLAADLYQELNGIPDFGFRLVMWTVGPGLINKNALVPLDQVVLSWAQVGLLLHRLADEILMSTVIKAGAAGERHAASAEGAQLSVDTASFRSSLPAAASHRPCENTDDPLKQEELNQKIKEVDWGFDKILEAIGEFEDSAVATGAKIVGVALTVVRTLTTYANLLAKLTSLHATFSLSNPPLVRTKEMTPGEIRDLTITYSFDKESWGNTRECINSSLKYAGLEIPGIPPDPPSGIDVELSSVDPSILRIGDGKGGNKPVNQDETDGNGVARFKLSGAPQKDLVPQQAQSHKVSIDVHAVSNLKSSDLFKDATSVPWDALDMVGSAGLSVIPELLGRTKFITFTETIPVVDWKLSAEFNASAKGELTVHRAENNVYQGCGATMTVNESVDGKSTFASNKQLVTAALLSNQVGNVGDQAFVFFPKGTTFKVNDLGEDGIEMFGLLADYSTKKSWSKPATGDQPSQKVDISTDCVGGGGYHPDTQTPASDCGLRTYVSGLDITMPSARHLYVSGEQSNESNLWKSCGNPLVPFDPPVAPSLQSCQSPQYKGGKIPSINDIFDPSIPKFDIKGSMNCIVEEPGRLQQVYYNWTLTLCRVVDGKPNC